MAIHSESIIDSDLHQTTRSQKDLYPYLSRAHQERIDLFGTGLSQRVGYPNGGDRGSRADSWPADGGPAGSDLDLMREQHLDRYNVEYGILLGQEYRPVSTLPDTDYANALARAYNDWMIELWIEKEPRLKGAAILATQDPKLAAAELRRVGQHDGIVGALVPNGARYPYGQRFYDPIFEACVELDLPFVLHTGSEGAGMNGQPTPVGYPSYYIELRQGRPLAYQSHLASMVFEGLFERYPTLTVVFIEGGFTWLPTFLWRLDADWKALGRETPWVKRPPSEYVYEHCRFTTQPMESPDNKQDLLTVLQWGRAEQTLLFASDYPHFDFDSPETSLPRMPEQMHKRIFSENAREVFKLPARSQVVESVAD